jgi:hypothetical protein
VTVDGGTIDNLEFGVVLAQSIDLMLDLFVLDVESRQRDLQTVVARDGNERTHLDDGVERHRAALLAAGDVDLGLRDRVELGVRDGLRVEVGYGLAQRFRSQCPGTTHARFEHLAGDLPGSKTRYTDLARQRPHDVTHGLVELGFVDFHAQADKVPLDWLSGRTHTN